MIRLFTKNYSNAELAELISYLEECVVMIKSASCSEYYDCAICEHKNVCLDIEKALDFVERKYSEKMRQK